MMAFNMLTCLVKDQFFSLEPCDRMIMFQTSFKGGEDLSDNEQEAFPIDALAEFVGGPGDQMDAADSYRKHELKLTSCLIFTENAKDELSYEDLVKLRVVSKSISHFNDAFRDRRMKHKMSWEKV